MFLLVSSDEDRALKEAQLITYTLVNMPDMALYTKMMELWNHRDAVNRKVWSEFWTFIIGQFKLILRESGGLPVAHEGYGGANNAVEDIMDDTSSLIKSGTKYSERDTDVEGKVSELQQAMAQL